jgi:hypothetical protein
MDRGIVHGATGYSEPSQIGLTPARDSKDRAL